MDPFLKAGIKIDKKYVISLDHRQDRKDSAIREFEKAGIENYIFYPGFNTRKIGVLGHYLKNYGTTGCYISHQALIHEAYANNYKNILIMEDDLGFVDDFNSIFQDYWKDIPSDYDLVWIGSNELKKGSSIKITDKVSIPGQVWGAHCYIVSQAGINKLYTHLNSTPMKNHVDVIINNIPGLIQFNFTLSLSNQKGMGTDNITSPGFINHREKFQILKKQPKKLF